MSESPQLFTLTNFYQTYVQQSSQTPVETLSISEIKSFIIQYMSLCRLGPKDVKIQTAKETIQISSRGLRVLYNFHAMKQQGYSATVIQTAWRKYQTRRKLLSKDVVQELDSSSVREHLTKISVAYDAVLGQRSKVKQQLGSQPSPTEIKFMTLLNSPISFKVSQSIKLNPILAPATPSSSSKSSLQTYFRYAPKLVNWLNLVLGTDIDEDAYLPDLLVSGDLLCRLSVTMFPKVQCHLLNKDMSFSIHKLIFFLELCKTCGVKSSLLFSVSDIFIASTNEMTLDSYNISDESPQSKSALIVLRTVCAFERQSRKKGWKGVKLHLSTDTKPKFVDDDKSRELDKRDTTTSAIYNLYTNRDEPETKDVSVYLPPVDNSSPFDFADLDLQYSQKAVPEFMMREELIQELLYNEESYMKNLTRISNFLKLVLKKRKRQSQRASKSLLLSTGTKITQQDINKFDYDNQELGIILAILEDIQNMHTQLRIDIEDSRDGEIGDILMGFVDGIVKPYITYSVLVFGVQEDMENVVDLLRPMVQDYFGKGEEGFSGVDEWKNFLLEPIDSVCLYEEVFSEISESRNGMRKKGRRMDVDDKKVMVSAIKIGVLGDNIKSVLNIS